MTDQIQPEAPLPFHESIVMLLRVQPQSIGAVLWLATASVIPKDARGIEAALERFFNTRHSCIRQTWNKEFAEAKANLAVQAQAEMAKLTADSLPQGKGGADDEGREVVFDATTVRSDLADPNDVCGSG